MIIAICRSGKIELRDQDDFKSFKIVDEVGLNPFDLAKALENVALLNSDNASAWVKQSSVPALIEGGPSADWLSRYGAMLEKASAFGWVRASDETVRAHIEKVNQ